MFPMIPFGPLSLPTDPILMLLAMIFGLEMAGRYGKRRGMAADDIWNIGLVSLCSGLIVARLWNVVQFWYVYQQEPLLIVSLRPSGFAFWPGLIAACTGGYLYLLRRALPPLPVVATFGVASLVASAVLAISAFLTGDIVGLPSSGPWALPYFGELRHPVALYQALGYLLVFTLIWLYTKPVEAVRVILWVSLGHSLIRLLLDGLRDSSGAAVSLDLVSGFRMTQVLALLIALAICWLLASRSAGHHSG